MLIRRPADVGKDAAGRKSNQAAAAIDDALASEGTELNPVLDASPMPIKFNLGEIAHRVHFLFFREWLRETTRRIL